MNKRSTLKFLAMFLLLAQLFSLTAGITVFATGENETERDEVIDYTTEIPEDAELVALPEPYVTYMCSELEAVSMGGYNYEDGWVFYSGTSNGLSEMSFNLDGKFSAITFDTGYISGADWNGTLTVFGDGKVLLDQLTMQSKDLPQTVTLNVEGVRQLRFYHEKPANGYNEVRYAACNLRGVLAEPFDASVLVSDEFFDIPRYTIKGDLITEAFEMGGKQYDAGYSFTTTGFESSKTANVGFNFKKQYEQISFDIGKCHYNVDYERTSVYFTIYVDGKAHPDYTDVEIVWNSLPTHVTLDLKGVSQVIIEARGTTSWYQSDTTRIGNIQLKSNGKPHGILLDAAPVEGTDDYTCTLNDENTTIALNPRVYPSDAPRDYEMKIAEGGEFITIKDNVVTAIHGGTAKLVYTLPNNKDVEVVCDITSKVTEHLWDEGEITKAPTLKEKGEKVYHCTLCDETKTEKLDKLTECEEHTWNEGEITKEPTYTKEGEALYTCTVCGKTENRVVEKLVCTEHAWDEGVVTKEPTYTEAGEKKLTCTNCGETKMEVIGQLSCTDHKWDDGKVTKEPTYEAEGEMTFTCENCGETKTEAIAKLIPENPFEDIGDEDWFRDPVLWAYNNGITGGIAANLFGPHESCTRGQVVTFLWAAAGKPAPNSDYNPFTDVTEADYFYKAVLWAVENGITKGIAEDLFGPAQACTRGQIVTFLWASHNRPAPTLTENPFIDFDSSAYYYQPILWAVENDITTGIGDGMFGPENICTRCQIVTFLYKASMIEQQPETPETPEDPVVTPMPEPTPDGRLVTDAYTETIEGKYYTHCYHIPRINLPEDRAAGWNEAMYDTLYGTIEKRVLKAMETKGQPELDKVRYSWGRYGNLVSIVIREDELEYDWSTHSFYTVSTETGFQVADSDIYAAYDMTEEDFFAAVKIVLAAVMAEEAEHYKNNLSNEKIQELIDKTLADENIKAAKPFISPDGKLSFMGGVYTPAGADRYYHLWTLEGNNITVKCDGHK